MTIPIQVSTSSTTRFGRRAWLQISKEAWTEAGDHWHEKILPKHFRQGAAAEYGYAPRSRAYMKQKAASKGHQRPDVYKGDLERQVLRLRDVRAIRARGESEGAVNVKLSGPRYLHQRQQPRQPNLALELSTVSERDADELADVIGEHVTAGLEAEDTARDPSE